VGQGLELASLQLYKNKFQVTPEVRFNLAQLKDCRLAIFVAFSANCKEQSANCKVQTANSTPMAATELSTDQTAECREEPSQQQKRKTQHSRQHRQSRVLVAGGQRRPKLPDAGCLVMASLPPVPLPSHPLVITGSGPGTSSSPLAEA
jgi:hypothetical protein